MKKSKSMQGMSRNKLIATVSLAVIVITMMASTSTAVLVYSTPTTEDEGWVEGDYEGSLEEQEEQAQEDWEDAGRPGDEDNGDDNDNEDDTENQDEETQICPDGSVLPVDQECPQPELQICPDGSAVQADEACPSVAEDEPESTFVTCFDGSSAATLAECPPTPEPVIPNTAFAPGFYAESVPETPEPLPTCDGSFQDCITPNGDFCQAGSGAHECEDSVTLGEEQELIDCNTYPENEYCNSEKGRDGLPFCDLVKNAGSCYDRNDNPEEYCSKYSNLDSDFCQIIKDKVGAFAPDEDCLFNVAQPKCTPGESQECPEGFGTNEDGQCFPDHRVEGCPQGYHTTEDDETGECNPNSECTGEGYVLVNNGQSCREKKTWCLENRGADECNHKEKTKIVHKTTVIQGSSATATANANANAADVSNCKLDGSTNGIQQKFDTPKYLACGLYTNGQKAYSDGFVMGCTQIGNTQLVCQALVDSSI